MGIIFQRYGKMLDVIISGRLNRNGKHFGFLIFVEVWDATKLEYQLEEIKIGNVKIHVNHPQYRRNEKVIHSQKEKQQQQIAKQKRVWKELKRSSTMYKWYKEARMMSKQSMDVIGWSFGQKIEKKNGWKEVFFDQQYGWKEVWSEV